MEEGAPLLAERRDNGFQEPPPHPTAQASKTFLFISQSISLLPSISLSLSLCFTFSLIVSLTIFLQMPICVIAKIETSLGCLFRLISFILLIHSSSNTTNE